MVAIEMQLRGVGCGHNAGLEKATQQCDVALLKLKCLCLH